MKKIVLTIFLLGCICMFCLSMHDEGGTFEEKVLGTCNLVTEDLSEINILYVDETDVQQYTDLCAPAQLQGFSEYFSDCVFIENKAEVFSSHTIQVAAPEKNTWFYLYIDNEGKYLEIQWFGPGNDDGSAVFESDHPLSVDELLAAMNVR